MTFEQFALAHAGRDFPTHDAFTAEVARAGLSDADRQRAYEAWRLGWGRAVSGGGELISGPRGRVKTWS
jgi:hypothetical protein